MIYSARVRENYSCNSEIQKESNQMTMIDQLHEINAWIVLYIEKILHMANKPTHQMSLVTKYKDGSGEEKNRFTRIASWRMTDSWNVFYEIPRWLLLSWTIMCGPIKERDQQQQQASSSHGDDWNEDLPF